jgi:hypothetical protein
MLSSAAMASSVTAPAADVLDDGKHVVAGPVGRKNLMQHIKRPADKHDGDLQAPVLQ